MKKIFTLLMLLCTISVFAANAAGTYTGRLTISVDGNAPTVKDGQNVIVTESDIVTLTIPDFSQVIQKQMLLLQLQKMLREI